MGIKNSGDTFDIIIGITRGGWIPTVMLSNHLDNTPIVSWEVSLRDGKKVDPCPINKQDLLIKKILIVDDLNDSGNTLKVIQDIVGGGTNIKYATLINNISSKFKGVHYWSEEIDKSIDDSWIVFPWEKQ